ncbi:MAG: thiamine pyrophosphate-dependent dehydrogenase E1 component subunit alpha [Vampirovibrio sp.]
MSVCHPAYSVDSMNEDLVRFDPQGALPSPEDLRKMYRLMLTLRLWDERSLKLQRSGRISFCVTTKGEEATQIGTVAALRPTDWVFPAYRQPGIPLWRGASLEALAHQIFGTALDISLGHQMPNHYSFYEFYYASISSVIGTQIVHAAGAALAAQIKDTDDIAVTYFGDGSTSANDFHSALTIAGAKKAPALFFCVNNHYAISMHVSQQTGAKTLADKGIGYGIHALRVDGNDILAVYQSTLAMAERARKGEGPALLELVTYRLNPHSSSDDDGRYRLQGEREAWVEKDPLTRFEGFLIERKLLNPDDVTTLKATCEAEILEATKTAQNTPAPDWQTLIEGVYADVPANLQADLDEIRTHEANLSLPHPGAFPL